jgi:hypothetical protein
MLHVADLDANPDDSCFRRAARSFLAACAVTGGDDIAPTPAG